jgi:hypothetical protein
MRVRCCALAARHDAFVLMHWPALDDIHWPKAIVQIGVQMRERAALQSMGGV